MGWDQTYAGLVDILYGQRCTTADLEAAVALATISENRRGEVTSEKVRSEFLEAVEEAIKCRMHGAMPPDDLKHKMRSFFLDA